MKRKKSGDHGELRSLELFAELPDDTLEAIERAARSVSHSQGDAIVREGGPGLGFHVILSGKAIVTIGGEEINRLGPGDFFGEMALLTKEPRIATVTAGSEGVRTLSIDAPDFRWLIEQHPDVAAAITRVAESRRRDQN